ncbi:MAG: protoheme IX farnesyltransferase [Ignavibacteriaceae bacterium]|nr:protoheme IX farnesyltransferase [Ignavibacteriaceae bacterium]
MKKYIQILSELTKIKITIFVTVTTILGYICAAGEINYGVILPALGILFIACGSAAINHYQERRTDALMDRTRNRPIPSGRISPLNALLIAITLVTAGFILLTLSGGILAGALSLLNLFWYNGLYTPLKKINPLAIIPGSMVGAIPPAVGWVSAGGSLMDPQIIIISFFFFIWQIPHFWLLLSVLGKDYEKAGFPTFSKLFSRDQFSRIIFMWIAATVVTSLMLPLFGIVRNPVISFALLSAGIWLTIKAVKLLKPGPDKLSFRFAFREINIFALIIVFLLSIDKMIKIYL